MKLYMKNCRKLYLFLFIIGLFSCQSIKKSFESQNYDSVVIQFKEKKKKASDEEIAMFEKAYKSAIERDKEQITTLKSLNDGNRWEEIFDLYTKINARQNSILRLLPVYYSNGSKAYIETFDLSLALEESRQNSAQFYYDKGIKLLNSGIKSSIRQSVDYFAASRKFYINYKDINELITEAESKGKNYVLLIVEKNPALLVPTSFEQSILENVKLIQKDQWVNIDYRRKDDIVYDYIVKLKLYSILVSPDALKEYNFTEEKTIEDGWQYVLDGNGNVKKDSSGNDIKIKKYSKIICQIRETRMNKTAQVFGDATIYEAQTNDYIKNQKCTGNATFDYSYFQFNGNKNALSDATLKKSGNPPALFPNTFDLVEQSKTELIRCYQDFISMNYNAFAFVK